MAKKYNYCVSVRGRFNSSFCFETEKEVDDFIKNDFLLLEDKHEKLKYTVTPLDGLQIDDRCHVWGDGDDVYIIKGIAYHDTNRPMFVLDSGFIESVHKCYKAS